ncbi:MAG: peptidoglycan bridge formation glycyltransferase FemA/FemB family protein [Patescibacteria group bacterium]
MWSDYLELYCWKSLKTANGVVIRIIRVLCFNVAKIQRPSPLSQKDIEEIKMLCRKKHVVYLVIEPSLNQDLQLLKKDGFRETKSPYLPPKTTIIDLTKDINALWNTLSKTARNSIKKAERDNIKIDIIQFPNQEALRRFHIEAKKTGKQKGFYVQGFSDILKKSQIFGNNSFLINSYTKEGFLANSNFYLAYQKKVWFMHAATTKEGRKSNSGYKLMWQAINYFKSMGFEKLDLEGIKDNRFPEYTKKWGGITSFKQKFGGEIVEFPPSMIKYIIPL